ncbi:hypothetical protein LCGC14_1294720 [marine sediment metagenome]|uniref:Uncharacterized protein n=1 Tax=marine sediment metagenome TaxID=412755 RepID=A0A0F9LC94_9ZZZZ
MTIVIAIKTNEGIVMTSGGSINIASITREKGFRWIQRQNSHIC